VNKEERVWEYDSDRIINQVVGMLRAFALSQENFETGLIISLGRDFSPAVNLSLAKKVKKWREVHGDMIVGLDLAGFEGEQTLSETEALGHMAHCYEVAMGNDGGRTVHCGETEHIDLATFKATIEDLKVSRVGHPIAPVRAYWEKGDASGLELMAELGVVAELCPWSNMLTKALPSLEKFGEMLGVFDKFNIRYTLSNDSPALQRTTLALEIEWLLEAGAINAEQLERSFQAADEASFLNLDA